MTKRAVMSTSKTVPEDSPQDVHHVPVNESLISSSPTSPGDLRIQAAQGQAYGAHQKLTNRRLSQVQAPDGLRGAQAMQRRDSLPSQASQHSRGSSGNPSLSSPPTPTMLNPAWTPKESSLTAIPEALTVQELAFRHGQQAHHVTADRIPSNPFAKEFEEAWTTYYNLGKTQGGKPVDTPAASSASAALSASAPPSYFNYEWPVLINPYTQNLKSPDGLVDLVWSRNICEKALNGMEAMIRVTCERVDDSEKLVIDIPLPCQQALATFPDLLDRYERLKRDRDVAFECVANLSRVRSSSSRLV
ncbi:uncharacterized protein K460DRAFT_115347 [Cucurbitaria berberidis CBS 394.84]|uniref:Uncharacterized protein n=1 Tax=Cucurbitaria berberidis CBS 394.84 TaxID=1168544 RepID=A0A9P4L8Y5_9PLEO|nr:uncharacterized protein K460DRAFT_115347 [Cucurbitaria berberidis CBS 394.84]KAF1845798.1 hypothetical protein K460DRAFT_115347 [Cucurbitaria berberidis CBS 394.84]